MKLQQSLMCALVVGISSGALLIACQQDDVKSGTVKTTLKKADKKEEPVKPVKDDCPMCGMG